MLSLPSVLNPYFFPSPPPFKTTYFSLLCISPPVQTCAKYFSARLSETTTVVFPFIICHNFNLSLPTWSNKEFVRRSSEIIGLVFFLSPSLFVVSSICPCYCCLAGLRFPVPHAFPITSSSLLFLHPPPFIITYAALQFSLTRTHSNHTLDLFITNLDAWRHFHSQISKLYCCFNAIHNGIFFVFCPPSSKIEKRNNLPF